MTLPRPQCRCIHGGAHGHGHGAPVEVRVPVRLSLGPVGEEIGALHLFTTELTDPPSSLTRTELREVLAGFLESAAARLRVPTV